MTTKTGKFLTQKEIELCEKISALDITLVSPRAQALILLNSGQTQAKSAELSSLTPGQLRYLIRLFKKKGIKLFPEGLFPEAKEEEVQKTIVFEPEPETKPEIEPETEAEPKASGKKVKKEKKKKKAKKKAKKKKLNKKKEKKKTEPTKEKKKKGKKKKKKA